MKIAVASSSIENPACLAIWSNMVAKQTPVLILTGALRSDSPPLKWPSRLSCEHARGALDLGQEDPHREEWQEDPASRRRCRSTPDGWKDLAGATGCEGYTPPRAPVLQSASASSTIIRK